jgi:hypothetical protein
MRCTGVFRLPHRVKLVQESAEGSHSVQIQFKLQGLLSELLHVWRH